MAVKRKLYTVYRSKDDAVLVFEETAERTAEILGIKIETVYQQACRQKNKVYKRPRYRMEVTCIADLDDEEEDDGEW